jgi:hypothetical protein
MSHIWDRIKGSQNLGDRHILVIRHTQDKRYELSMEEYDRLLVSSNAVKFRTRNVVLDTGFIPEARRAQGKETLFLTQIKEFQRPLRSGYLRRASYGHRMRAAANGFSSPVFLRKCPYISSSTNSTHLNSINCAFWSCLR